MTTILSTLSNTLTMSLITIDQFEHFVAEFPEMEQCYSFFDVRYDDYCKDASDDDDDPWDNFALDWEEHS